MKTKVRLKRCARTFRGRCRKMVPWKKGMTEHKYKKKQFCGKPCQVAQDKVFMGTIYGPRKKGG